jgi:hypothetical protein
VPSDDPLDTWDEDGFTRVYAHIGNPMPWNVIAAWPLPSEPDAGTAALIDEVTAVMSERCQPWATPAIHTADCDCQEGGVHVFNQGDPVAAYTASKIAQIPADVTR